MDTLHNIFTRSSIRRFADRPIPEEVLHEILRAFQPAPDYWVVDGAIAGENMLLAARSLGVEGVWLGTWPQMDRVHRQAALFGLPDTVVPHSVLALGYPAEAPSDEERNLYEEDRVHMGKW